MRGEKYGVSGLVLEGNMAIRRVKGVKAAIDVERLGVAVEMGMRTRDGGAMKQIPKGEKSETYALVMRVPPCCGGKVVADAESEGAKEDGSDAVVRREIVFDAMMCCE